MTGNDIASYTFLTLLLIVYPIFGFIGETRERRAFKREARNMFLTDGLGNPLEKNDLVVYTDNFGHPQLCMVAAIEPGTVQLQPLWVPVPFDLKHPQVQRVIKVQQPSTVPVQKPQPS